MNKMNTTILFIKTFVILKMQNKSGNIKMLN